VRKLFAWLLAGVVLLLRRRARPTPDTRGTEPEGDLRQRERIVPASEPAPAAELAVAALFAATALCAIGFVVVYVVDRIGHRTQFLGLSLGLAFLCLAAAFVVAGRWLVADEELAESYPQPDSDAQDDVTRIVEESTDGLTRRGLLVLTGAGAGGALGLALLAPAASLGPLLDWERLSSTPWRVGRRLVDEHGRPLLAREIEESVFYTAYPEGAPREDIAAPVVVVRLPPAELRLPADRRGWAPRGILAYSKICTHAGCAISLYRAPLYAPTTPRPALVCPCHYSTFDPAAAGAVLFGPAGRPLPQLPLRIGPRGELQAAGPFSAGPGPSWWGADGRAGAR
jgi:ubiquinol-cytochrome c reductase iron-sulfur subunit